MDRAARIFSPSLGRVARNERGGARLLVLIIANRHTDRLVPRSTVSPLKNIFQTKVPCDCVTYGLAVIFDVFVSESNHVPARILKVMLTNEVLLLNLIVVAAIDFNHEHLSDTRKVGDKRSNRVFASELQAAQLTGPQNAKQKPF